MWTNSKLKSYTKTLSKNTSTLSFSSFKNSQNNNKKIENIDNNSTVASNVAKKIANNLSSISNYSLSLKASSNNNNNNNNNKSELLKSQNNSVSSIDSKINKNQILRKTNSLAEEKSI